MILQSLASLVLLVIPVVGAYGVTLLKKHATQNQIVIGLSIAHIVVRATEQVAATTGMTSSTKYAEALDRALNLGKRLGVDFTTEQWRGFIEQAVHELNLSFAPILPAIAVPAVPAAPPPGVPATPAA
jgi:hypothetical protein